MAKGADPNAGLQHFEVIVHKGVVMERRIMIAAADKETAVDQVNANEEFLTSKNGWKPIKDGKPAIGDVVSHGECGNRTGRPAPKKS